MQNSFSQSEALNVGASAPLRVALIDDHLLFRDGLRALLASTPDIEVVAEASHSAEVFPLIERTALDVVVLDLSLPGTSGIAVTRAIGRATKVLILTMHANESYVADALAAGARGYALKHQPIEQIVEAIRCVGGEQQYLAPSIPKISFASIKPRRAMQGTQAPPLDVLTSREREIFELIVCNTSNREIAAKLCVSVKTVETHRASINRKLRVHSPGELIRFAALHGLIRAMA